MFGSPQAASPFLKFWQVFRLFLDLFDLTQKTVEREFIRTVVQRLWQRRLPWWDGPCCARTRWRRTRGRRSSSALTRTCSSSPLRCSRWSRRGGAGTCQSLRRRGSRWEGWPLSWAALATGWTWPRLGLLGSRGSSRTPWQQQKTSEVFQFVFDILHFLYVYSYDIMGRLLLYVLLCSATPCCLYYIYMHIYIYIYYYLHIKQCNAKSL